VALEYYSNKKTFEGNLSLKIADEIVPLTPTQFAGRGEKERHIETLSTIIEKINKRFGTEFTPIDQLSVEQIKEDFVMDEDMINKAKTNSMEDFRYAFEKAFMGEGCRTYGSESKVFYENP
jgi:type I restriction enzyme R subunit